MVRRVHTLTLPTRRAAVIGALAGLVALRAGGARALGGPDAEGFVKAVVDELRGLITNGDASESGALKFLSILERRSALDAVAKFAVGRTWLDMSDAQKAEYEEAFRAYIARTYQKRFGEYAGEDIIVTGSVDAGKKGILVKSTLKRPSAEDITVEWLVSDRSGQVLLSDMLFEGVSLAITLRETFGGMIETRNGDIDKFIADLKSSESA